ncbi:hypothetical protein [Oceanobacillus salinisoli]|uniref:hypothetical protein n=1 Tax=Oceanobacillus salinisoli TaxID=2678611 RepID=UPI0012E24752|nr:hypothetical protein [Oceanobacillus salinisoli]
MVGKNPDLTIGRIKADLYYENFNFTADVSTDEMFVRYKHLPNDIEKPFPAELTYFYKNDSVVELKELLN